VDGHPVHLMIGSILHWADENTVVWGTGFGTADAEIRAKPLKVCAVRGPLTRKRLLELGVPCPEVYGDPALLYSRYHRMHVDKKYDIGLIPNYMEYKNDAVRKLAQTSKSISVIDVARPVNKVVDDIRACSLIASSSLHGLIIAHSYGLKALHIVFDPLPARKYFKYHDYHQSVGMNRYEGPYDVGPATTIKELIGRAQLVEDAVTIDLDRLLDACPFLPRDSDGRPGSVAK